MDKITQPWNGQPLTEAEAPDWRPTHYGAMRQMTPNEIRYDELSQLLDFVSGDPIDGEPSKKQIRDGIKHRLAELSPISAEPTAEQSPSPEPGDGFFEAMGPMIDDMRKVTEQLQVREDRQYLAEAVATGLELLKMSIGLTDELTVVDSYPRRELGNAIAWRLSSVIKDRRWDE